MRLEPIVKPPCLTIRGHVDDDHGATLKPQDDGDRRRAHAAPPDAASAAGGGSGSEGSPLGALLRRAVVRRVRRGERARLTARTNEATARTTTAATRAANTRNGAATTEVLWATAALVIATTSAVVSTHDPSPLAHARNVEGVQPPKPVTRTFSDPPGVANTELRRRSARMAAGLTQQERHAVTVVGPPDRQAQRPTPAEAGSRNGD